MLFSPEPVRRLLGPHQPADVPVYRQVYPQLVAELRRARRYEHRLVVAVMSPYVPGYDPARPRGGGAKFGAPAVPQIGAFTPVTPPTMYFLLGSYLRNTLRETDILTAAPQALSYAAFLAETARESGEQAVARLRAGFRACSGVELRVGIAEFPRDGLTIEDLLDRAWDAWHTTNLAELPADVVPEASHG